MFALVARAIGQGGSIGVFFLMLVENLIPIIPSELILPLAGFEAAQGRLHPALAIIAGAAGSVIGTLPWFWLGRRLGAERIEAWTERYGRWIAITPGEVRRGTSWLVHHGAPAIILGRCVPGVRGVIALPAGVVGMSLTGFLVWCGTGSLMWSALLVGAGYLLMANYAAAEHWLGPVGLIVLLGCVAAYVLRLIVRR